MLNVKYQYNIVKWLKNWKIELYMPYIELGSDSNVSGILMSAGSKRRQHLTFHVKDTLADFLLVFDAILLLFSGFQYDTFLAFYLCRLSWKRIHVFSVTGNDLPPNTIFINSDASLNSEKYWRSSGFVAPCPLKRFYLVIFSFTCATLHTFAIKEMRYCNRTMLKFFISKIFVIILCTFPVCRKILE